MAQKKSTRRRAEDAEDEAITEAVEETKSGSRNQPPRLSITISPKLRRAIRIASARADLEPGEWAKAVLAAASKKTVEKLYGEED
jgi:hypothetical protein